MGRSPGLACSRRRGMSGLKLLGIVFVALVLICGGTVTYVAMHFRPLMAGWIREPLLKAIEASNLGDDQKKRLSAIFRPLVDAFEGGDISYEQVGQLAEKLTEGPFFNLVLIEVLETEHAETVEPDEEAGKEVAVVFDRFERGFVEGTISEEKVAEVLDTVSTTRKDKGREPKKDLSKEQLEAFVVAMKEKADEAGVPDGPYQVDFAAELAKAVTEVLGADWLVEAGIPAATQPASAAAPATSPAAQTAPAS